MIVFLLIGLAVTSLHQAAYGDQLTSDEFGGMVLTPASIIQKEARGPNRFAYSVNLLVGLNSTLSVSTLNQSRPIYWALAQRLTNSSSTLTTQLYMLGNPSIRQDPVLRSTYQCSPNETECLTITVPSIKLQSIGDFTYQSLINGLDSLYVDYNVSAWVQPLDFGCDSLQQQTTTTLDSMNNQTTASSPLCAVNRTLGLVSVLGSSRVTVTCSILVAQNDVYEPQADVVIRSVEDNTECSDTESTQVRIIPAFMASTILGPLKPPGSSPVNTVLYRLSRNCTRVFTKAALNSHLTCSLEPRPPLHNPPELRPTAPYTSLSMTVDVQYAPEYSAPPSQQFNRTMIVNSSAPAPFFTCPFDSNPAPQFEWRVSFVQVNRSDDRAGGPARRRIEPTEFHSSSKDYPIPRDLDVGLYGFECRARTSGLVNKYSDTVKFYLSVIPVPVSSKIGSPVNVGAIVGGVVGGILAILVIVLLVLFLIRRHKGHKDEPEKAKELDIGINDNNPHLSSRSNLSTAGLTAATTTTTSSSSGSSSNGTTTTTTATSHMNGGLATNKSNGHIGHKAIAGLMVPSSTAQSYAAIAHAAAAAAAQQNRNIFNGVAGGGGGGDQHQQVANGGLKHVGGQSYNNPGFFESTTSYNIPQNHLESPPPYDSALHNQQQQQQQQQQPTKKDSSMILQSQQKDYMGSNSRLLMGGGSGSNSPTLVHKNPNGSGVGVGGGGMPQSHSYTHQLGMNPSTPSSQMQQMQYPGSGNNLQYTTVQNLARNRQPLSGPSATSGGGGDMDPQAATQYTTMTQLNPIDV